jgi:parallel beta-helix repeat protein
VQLQNVEGVRISGFTFLEWGLPMTPSVYTAGEAIRLVGANHNQIDHNYMAHSTMMGITLSASAAYNVIEYNVAVDNDVMGTGCGYHLGAGVHHNILRHNVASGHPLAGIMMSASGPGNVIYHNVVNGNGQAGVWNGFTPDTVIRDNVANNMQGRIGDYRQIPPDAFYYTPGAGIYVLESTGVIVEGNVAQNAFDTDVMWDGVGSNTWAGNNCKTETHPGLCSKGQAK